MQFLIFTYLVGIQVKKKDALTPEKVYSPCVYYFSWTWCSEMFQFVFFSYQEEGFLLLSIEYNWKPVSMKRD